MGLPRLVLSAEALEESGWHLGGLEIVGQDDRAVVLRGVLQHDDAPKGLESNWQSVDWADIVRGDMRQELGFESMIGDRSAFLTFYTKAGIQAMSDNQEVFLVLESCAGTLSELVRKSFADLPIDSRVRLFHDIATSARDMVRARRYVALENVLVIGDCDVPETCSAVLCDMRNSCTFRGCSPVEPQDVAGSEEDVFLQSLGLILLQILAVPDTGPYEAHAPKITSIDTMLGDLERMEPALAQLVKSMLEPKPGDSMSLEEVISATEELARQRGINLAKNHMGSPFNAWSDESDWRPVLRQFIAADHETTPDVSTVLVVPAEETEDDGRPRRGRRFRRLRKLANSTLLPGDLLRRVLFPDNRSAFRLPQRSQSLRFPANRPAWRVGQRLPSLLLPHNRSAWRFPQRLPSLRLPDNLTALRLPQQLALLEGMARLPLLRNLENAKDARMLQRDYWLTEFHKACWSLVNSMNDRKRVLPIAFPGTVCYFDPEEHPQVKGMIALTIDDAPCRSEDTNDAMVNEVLDLLKEYGAFATFFLCTDLVKDHEAGLRKAIAEGHEVANHCPEDRSYAADTEEAFEAAFLRAESVCDRLRADNAGDKGPPVRWFRAPHARLSDTMRKVIQRHGFTHVLGDCYANDPWIADPEYIARTMLDSVDDGSVVVIHMPERGFREYNLKALRLFLEGLRERGTRILSLTQLHAETLKPAPGDDAPDPADEVPAPAGAVPATAAAGPLQQVVE